VAPHREQPPHQAGRRADQGADGDRERQVVTDDRQDGSGQRGGRVELSAEDRGHPAGQQVAQHPAADRGEHAHQRSREGAEPVLQRLEGAGDAEQGEAEGVEDADLALETPHGRVVPEGHQPGGRRHHQVAPVGQRRGRGGVDEDVAQEAAAEPRRPGQHEHPEDVELLAHRDQRPGDREDEDADQVEHDEDGLRLER
jgi:hypothetical protein